jgi:antitoxin component YwqK of YwqJK toxin-antitoxin module
MYGKGNWFGRDTLFRGYILNGKRQGVWKYYEAHSNADKIFEGIYKGDLRNGVFRKYYPSSDLLVYEESYKDNLPDGSFTWWYRNRQVESKRYFKNGVPTGEWFFYDENGRLIKHEFH